MGNRKSIIFIVSCASKVERLSKDSQSETYEKGKDNEGANFSSLQHFEEF